MEELKSKNKNLAPVPSVQKERKDIGFKEPKLENN